MLLGWDALMGFSFENVVLNNRKIIWDQLKLSPDDIVNENPFFQHKTMRAQGCQIDYMIQTKFNTLYICEIKFSKHEIGVSIIEEVRAKIEKLAFARGFSCRPVLIQVNGVVPEVVERGYFAEMVDFGVLLS